MTYTSSVPPHLATISWLAYEKTCALSIAKSLKRQLTKLASNADEESVHDSRVALRRWDSLWSVLKHDGWQSKKFSRKFGKPMHKLINLLGELRDLDVNSEIAQELGISANVLKTWQDEQHALRKKVKDKISCLDLVSLNAELKDYLKKRPGKITKMHKGKDGNPSLAVSAYDHLDKYLSEQESVVAALNAHASTAHELHKLRLEIKCWRYMLAEFFGLTNLQLTKAQQYLGKLNDYNRVSNLIGDSANGRAKAKLKRRYAQTLSKFQEIRGQLCYGLRPEIRSW